MVRRYLDLLSGTFVVRQLRPWSRNLGKRVVKSANLYVADSGLLHSLLGCETPRDLAGHPKVGASFEGFALEQVVRRLGALPEECFFWAVHAGAELDLLVVRGRKRLGFEFKRTDAPRLTSSIGSALEVPGVDRLEVVHAGATSYPLHRRVRALALVRLLEDLAPL